MKASEVKAGMRNLDLDLKLVELEEARTFVSRQGQEGMVATGIGEDDSGTVKVSIWNENVSKVKKGDQIHIRNGYSRLFRDEVHVSAGMYGKLEVGDLVEEPSKEEGKSDAAEKTEEEGKEEGKSDAAEKTEEEGKKEA